MAVLASDLRRQLENVCIAARDKAEEAARSALQKRAVDSAKPFDHFTAADRNLRNRLRARGRQAGDIRNEKTGTQGVDQLTQELAYEYWHRMLFARFLAENHLLMHPDGVAVNLEECDELAKNEGAANGFAVAARYASRMLPQIFRSNDVLLEIEFAPEHRIALEKLLASLPRTTFLADDSLGWVYQYWQSKKKDEVNKSGEKIDGRTLPAVTQLFTEDYMVQFLLQNTIGAWWCAQHEIKGPSGGAGIPAGKCPVEMPYLRWRDDGTPAAGCFEGWPKTLKEFTMLDPCCGSGHFLVSAFPILVPLRMLDEGLTAREACDAVLRENLFGLEIDPRCTQIAAFALALAAWKYPGTNGVSLGYRGLPPLNIACSGQSVSGKKDEWLTLANGDSRLQEGMDVRYELSLQAPDLGSLIDPRRECSDVFVASFGDLQPLLQAALIKAEDLGDADARAIGVAAQGIAKATEILSRRYTLVTTNVPYLARSKQANQVQEYCKAAFHDAYLNLGTCFISRSRRFCQNNATLAIVVLQSWAFQPGYTKFRKSLLQSMTWNSFVRLGMKAFQSQLWDFPTCLLITSESTPSPIATYANIDADSGLSWEAIQQELMKQPVSETSQAAQLANPDHRIAAVELKSSRLLNGDATCVQGLATSDDPQFTRCFWELSSISNGWEGLMGTVPSTTAYGGRERVLHWEQGKGRYYRHAQALKAEGRLGGWKSGTEARGKLGVLVSQMNTMPVTLYAGEFYDHNASVIVPNDPTMLAAIWAFASSSEFVSEVRKLDQSLKPSNSVFVKTPFDAERWTAVAKRDYPHGLPKPHSDDPTQWLFDGQIVTAKYPLQVAVARLLGYCWPEQSKTTDASDELVDHDGIVCVPAVRGEKPASERLVEVLHAAYGKKWSNTVLHDLVTSTSSKAGTSLDDWLRNAFFEQHCTRFHSRPFIWHIWDGRKDGFSCLVNYHKLNHKTLDNLTHSYLADWIKEQNADAKSGKVGADLRLAAAQSLQEKLKLILTGEPPYDIFVRWKPLHEQAIGWNPDQNDGVRQNIRPFIAAGILRQEPKSLLKDKDRGKEPKRQKDDYPWFWKGSVFAGDRINDVHLTIAEKQVARTEKESQ